MLGTKSVAAMSLAESLAESLDMAGPPSGQEFGLSSDSSERQKDVCRRCGTAFVLGLPPGWRFLLADGYEDVWEDASLPILDGQP